MKHLLLLLALSATAACSSKDDPAPPPAATTANSYTDASGQKTSLASVVGYSVTATPGSSGKDRRAFVVRTVLPNATTLDITYTYYGSTFPGKLGPVALDEGVRAANYTASATGTNYLAPISTGTVSVESVTPQVISGTYDGPLTTGGPSVHLVFTKLAL